MTTEKKQPTIKQQDGGYYALKGFAYQIDKAILELLTTKDENKPINVEQIQDINDTDFVIQVKYKETAKLTPSQVKKPIFQLLEEFKKDSTKKYILYAYFADTNGYEQKIKPNKKISPETLDTFLGDLQSKFTKAERVKFSKTFYFDLSPKFQTQFSNVIRALKSFRFINSNEAAMFYYSNAADFICKLVTNNKQIKNRTCTKKALVDHLKSGRALVFNSAFRDYQGDKKYFNFIKNKHFSTRNIDYFERIVIIDCLNEEDCLNIKEAVLKIKNKFYKKSGLSGKQVIKSPAPYMYLKNISPCQLANLKKDLQKININFKDGFDFFGSDFNLQSIKTKSTVHNNLCLKIINKTSILQTLLKENFQRPLEVYQFFKKNPINTPNHIKNIEIKIEDLSYISNIL